MELRHLQLLVHMDFSASGVSNLEFEGSPLSPVAAWKLHVATVEEITPVDWKWATYIALHCLPRDAKSVGEPLLAARMAMNLGVPGSRQSVEDGLNFLREKEILSEEVRTVVVEAACACCRESGNFMEEFELCLLGLESPALCDRAHQLCINCLSTTHVTDSLSRNQFCEKLRCIRSHQPAGWEYAGAVILACLEALETSTDSLQRRVAALHQLDERFAYNCVTNADAQKAVRLLEDHLLVATH